jgi:hypothetical protein
VRFFEAITLLAVLCAIGRFVLRGKYIREGSLMLAQDQADARALKRWQTGHIIGYALSEAIALYGFNFALRWVYPPRGGTVLSRRSGSDVFLKA